jgi:hypothetical protein
MLITTANPPSRMAPDPVDQVGVGSVNTLPD